MSRSFRRTTRTDDNSSQVGGGTRSTKKCRQLPLLLLLLSSLVASFLMLSSSTTRFVADEEYIQPTMLIRGQKEKESDNEKQGPNLHLVFSTDCAPYQHWQSYVLYFSAVQAKQPGKITRIISGCSDEQLEEMIKWHKQNVLPLLPPDEPKKFPLHFTPNYDHPIVNEYIFVNKPFGLLHFFEFYDDSLDEHGISSAARYIQRAEEPSLKLNPDDIIFVIDPDMMFLRPISHDFRPSSTYEPRFGPGNSEINATVEHGRPFGGSYGVGTVWRNFNLKYITGSDTTPALLVSEEEAATRYIVGSPYVSTMADMYAITPTWLEAVHRTREEYREHISEMYSYIIGAAHAALPHVVMESLMISGDAGGEEQSSEGWDFVNNIPAGDVCTFAASTPRPDTSCSGINECRALRQMPHFLHFCQEYSVGEWWFNKHYMPRNYFSCESPIMATPPANLASDYDYRVHPDEASGNRTPLNELEVKRNAFLVCALSKILQDAAAAYKTHSCEEAKDAEGESIETNWSHTLNLFELRRGQTAPNAEEPQRRVRSEIQNPNLHVAFSTDCYPHQNWESYLLYYSAVQVKQPGQITRIISGCTNDEMEEMIKWHVQNVLPLSPPDEPKKFTLHFTPTFDHKTVRDYIYVNKPYAILHFLEHYDDSLDEHGVSAAARDIQRDEEPSLKLNPDDVIVVIDPDMVFLRPITHDFTPSPSVEPKFAPGNSDAGETVQHGRPFGASHDIGTLWRTFQLPYITGSETTPASEVSEEDAEMHYTVGSPYVSTVEDMYAIAPTWIEAVPKTRYEYPHQTAEMFSYIIGAAHAELPHVVMESLIISGDAGGKEESTEGWHFLDNIPSDNVCTFAASVHSLRADARCENGDPDATAAEPDCLALRQIPNVLHFSQDYGVGEWWFSKHHFPDNYFSCESAIMSTPPSNLGSGYTYRIHPGEQPNEKIPLTSIQVKRNAFIICALSKLLQDASESFKSRNCEADRGDIGTKTNWNKTLNLREYFKLQEEQKQEPTEAHPYLNEEQLSIVQTAKMQSIVYEDFAGGNREHPHMGALDESGNPGYVHNATALRLNPPALERPDTASVCEDDSHSKILMKTKVDLEGNNAAEQSGKPRVKIFCVSYTTEKNHHKIPALRETWAQKCDGFMIPSTVTDISLGTVNILHEGEEDYWNIWQKVRSIWAYVYDNYYNDYDWFHLGGDDMYLLVENLRLYLESDVIRSAANGGKEPLDDWSQEYQTPVYLGRRLAEHGKLSLLYNHGGSGYTLNKAALKTLIRLLPVCDPHLQHAWEDVLIGVCLQKEGIFPFITQDDNGSQRYNPLSPGHHYEFRAPSPGEIDWFYIYNIDELKFGAEACADYSVAFHYADEHMLRRMHAILYHGYCSIHE